MYPHAHSIPSHRSLPTHSSIPALKDTKTSVYMPNNKVTADTYTQLCHLWVMVVDLTRTHARSHVHLYTQGSLLCLSPPLQSTPLWLSPW